MDTLTDSAEVYMLFTKQSSLNQSIHLIIVRTKHVSVNWKCLLTILVINSNYMNIVFLSIILFNYYLNMF